jgi:large subunit ribosomal protein L10
MNASLSQAASLFAAPLSQTARVVEALRAKVEEQGPADAAPSTSPTEDVAEGGDITTGSETSEQA